MGQSTLQLDSKWPTPKANANSNWLLYSPHRGLVHATLACRSSSRMLSALRLVEGSDDACLTSFSCNCATGMLLMWTILVRSSNVTSSYCSPQAAHTLFVVFSDPHLRPRHARIGCYMAHTAGQGKIQLAVILPTPRLRGTALALAAQQHQPMLCFVIFV